MKKRKKRRSIAREIRNDEIVQAAKKGMSLAKIAKVFRLERTTIYRAFIEWESRTGGVV